MEVATRSEAVTNIDNIDVCAYGGLLTTAHCCCANTFAQIVV